MKLIGVITNPTEVGTILRAGPGLPRIEIRSFAMRRVAAAVVRTHNGKAGVPLE